MNGTYGDADPEDAYDAGDPLDDRLQVIARTVASTVRNPTRRRARLADVVAVLDRLVAELVD